MKLFPKKTTQRGSTRRTLEAAVARRASRASMIEEDEEPTTSFKTALIVVLLLHVVAGVGVLMFDRIKTRRLSHAESAASVKKEAALAVSAPITAPAAVAPKPSIAPSAPVETAKKSAPAAPLAAAAPSRPAPPVAELKDSGATYSVVKGDKLASIARKLKVNYDDLLKLNKINDPKKLRIGQKLRIPAKPRPVGN